MKWLMHYGTPRHSGRYPWGSGANPYQTERKSLKKGSVRSTVSTNKNLNKELDPNRPLYTYDKNNPWDSKVYEGPFSHYKTTYFQSKNNDNSIYSHDYKVKKDLKLASKNERKKIFNDMFKDDELKESIKDSAKAVQSLLPSMDYLKNRKKEYPNDFSIDRKIRIKEADFTKKNVNKDVAYEAFTFALERPEYWKATSQYLKNISKKYDAMVDDNNFDIYNKVKDPVIIFRVKETLEYAGKRKISNLEIENNTKYARFILSKAGISLKI